MTVYRAQACNPDTGKLAEPFDVELTNLTEIVDHMEIGARKEHGYALLWRKDNPDGPTYEILGLRADSTLEIEEHP